MRRGRVNAAVFSAAAFVACWFCISGGPGRADDAESRVLLFSGRDIWRNGAFAHGGLLIAPRGFEQDGLMLKLLLSGGLYRYTAASLGGEQVIGVEGTLQVMPGYRIKRGDVEVKFFVGLDAEQHWLWPDDPSNNLRGRLFGVRAATDIWYEPTPRTVAMLDASVSTIATQHYVRGGFGWRVLDDQFYFGPEAAYFGSEGYRHFRLGAHLTGLKTDRSQWSIAGGWAKDSDGVSSPYVRLGLMQKL